MRTHHRMLPVAPSNNTGPFAGFCGRLHNSDGHARAIEILPIRHLPVTFLPAMPGGKHDLSAFPGTSPSARGDTHPALDARSATSVARAGAQSSSVQLSWGSAADKDNSSRGDLRVRLDMFVVTVSTYNCRSG